MAQPAQEDPVGDVIFLRRGTTTPTQVVRPSTGHGAQEVEQVGST